MLFSKARMALISALASAALLGSLGLAALPANAATGTTNAGSIVCSGDLCIQTETVNTTVCLAVVAAWADTSDFTGHFEMAVPSVGYTQNSTGGDKESIAGGANFKFTVPFYGEGVGYQATAWRHNSNGTYTNIGRVNFTINVPSFC